MAMLERPRGGRIHDLYGRQLLVSSAAGLGATPSAPAPHPFVAGGSINPDGMLTMPGGVSVVVEFKSRVAKQVRGTVYDIERYPCSLKLLVIMPTPAVRNARLLAEQCRELLAERVPRENFRVIVLKGTGARPRLEGDAGIIAEAVRELAGL